MKTTVLTIILSLSLGCLFGQAPSSVEAVNLGLSVKWASCNVGANYEHECGGYYAWGETTEKDFYNIENYKLAEYTDNKYYYTKYCSKEQNGIIDNKNVLEPEDDAATANWGKNWRTPTIYEMNELLWKCTWEWYTFGNTEGYKVTGPTGNSIFLPWCGFKDTLPETSQRLSTYYWTATRDEYMDELANMITFHNDGSSLSSSASNATYRDLGFCIRPVYCSSNSNIQDIELDGDNVQLFNLFGIRTTNNSNRLIIVKRNTNSNIIYLKK